MMALNATVRVPDTLDYTALSVSMLIQILAMFILTIAMNLERIRYQYCVLYQLRKFCVRGNMEQNIFLASRRGYTFIKLEKISVVMLSKKVE